MSSEMPATQHRIIEQELEKWDIHLIIRLLRLYGAHRCLWDSIPENRNRKLRKAALIDIACAMGGGITEGQVVQKINILRATYRYERRRIKQRMRKGIGAKTKLKWFALADSFLRNVPRIGRLRRKSRKTPDSDSDLENAMVLTVDPETIMQLDDLNQVNEYSVVEVKSEQNDENLSIENPVPINMSKEEKHKNKWTNRESLKFIELLKAQPALWSESLSYSMEDEENALRIIAIEMRMPVSGIRRRVKIFKETWQTETEKIQSKSDYKPRLVWWEAAESFMNEIIPNTDIDYFVDANASIPPTPMEYKSEHFDYPEDPSTPINPLPSVLTTLPNDLDDEDDDDDNDTNRLFTMQRENLNSPAINSTSSTKLIWNGLEDDLLEGKWSLKHSVKFLRLYGAHHCLWDLNHPDYRSRELRAAAIEDIAAAMGYGLNADYVAKKIKIFRITYMQHRKRMLEATKSGQAPEIQLRWFPLADSFLRPHIGLRSIKEQEQEIPQFDFQYVMANLNLIDPELLKDFRSKISQNTSDNGMTNGTDKKQLSTDYFKEEKF